jgi:hypothetical protein
VSWWRSAATTCRCIAKQFLYVYHFGDDWRHAIRVKRIEQQDDEPYGAASVGANKQVIAV